MVAVMSRKKAMPLNIADAAAALTVAKETLALAVEEFVQWPLVKFDGVAWVAVPGEFSDSFTLDDLRRVHRNVRKLRQLLLRRVGSASPTLAPAAFEAIKTVANKRQMTSAHLEASFFALTLAERCGEALDVAMRLAVQMCRFEIEQGLAFSVPVEELDQILGRHRHPSRSR